MYCAACVESCPASAIVTIQDFEMSTPNLQTLKADKDFLDLQGMRAQQWYSPKIGVEYRENVTSSNLHGAIVKAPLSDQPGGLAEAEKLKAAGEALPTDNRRRPALPMSELPVAVFQELKHEAVSAPAVSSLPSVAPVVPTIAVSIPAAEAVPVAAVAEGAAPARSKKIKRWGEPKAEEAAVDIAPAQGVAVVAPVVEAGSSEPASAEPAPVAEAPAEKPRSPKIKRWEPKQ
jgi:ferredoxin